MLDDLGSLTRSLIGLAKDQGTFPLSPLARERTPKKRLTFGCPLVSKSKRISLQVGIGLQLRVFHSLRKWSLCLIVQNKLRLVEQHPEQVLSTLGVMLSQQTCSKLPLGLGGEPRQSG